MNTMFHKLGRMFRKPMVAGVVGASVLMLAAAAPARADHRISGSVIISSGHSYDRDCDRCAPRFSYADREFDRGLSEGDRHGFDAGFRDGIRGGRYCNEPTASFCYVSGYFRDGYMEGFTKAYRAGFDKGNRERCAAFESHRRWR